MSKVIVTVINNCSDCPHVSITRHYTEDSFEQVFAWSCTAVQKQIGLRDIGEVPKIPTFCTLPEKEPVLFSNLIGE